MQHPLHAQSKQLGSKLGELHSEMALGEYYVTVAEEESGGGTGTASFFNLVPHHLHPPSCADCEFSQEPWVLWQNPLQKATHYLPQLAEILLHAYCADIRYCFSS